jgi:hypothetical protein
VESDLGRLRRGDLAGVSQLRVPGLPSRATQHNNILKIVDAAKHYPLDLEILRPALRDIRRRDERDAIFVGIRRQVPVLRHEAEPVTGIGAIDSNAGARGSRSARDARPGPSRV